MQEQELIGTIIGWVLDKVVGIIMGAVVGTAIPLIWRRFNRRRIATRVSEAYELLQVVCEPEVLDPKNPGNPAYMKVRARDYVNRMIRPLERAGFLPPQKCTTKEESLQEWYEFLEDAQIILQ